MFKSAYAFTIKFLLAVVHKVPCAVAAKLFYVVPKDDFEVVKSDSNDPAFFASVAAVTNPST